MESGDLKWLVGWLEGEGCFTWEKANSRPVLKVNCTDQDVLERGARLMGSKVYGPYSSKNPRHSRQWITHLHGRPAATRAVVDSSGALSRGFDVELTLKRYDLDDRRTHGWLDVAGQRFAALEDPVGPGPRGEVAIPAGRYQVEVTYSPRFNRRLPLLLDVPDFEGIRIHAGNTAVGPRDDTLGCVLVGMRRGDDDEVDNIWRGREAEGKVVALLDTPGPHWLTIEEDPTCDAPS